jgi:simple sugar transport system substrate-binding protein
MRFLIPSIALLVVLLGACRPVTSGDDPERPIRIVVVTHGAASDPFWSVVKNGVDQAQADLGVTVEYRAPETFDMPRMSQLIDAAVASRPDGLAVSVPDVDALGDAVRGAVDAGIPVVSLNSGSDVYAELGVLRHVGQTEYEAGLAAGKRMANLGVHQALCVNHEVGNVAQDLRCDGFGDGLGRDVEVLAVSMDPTEVRNAVTAALRQRPEVDGILATGPLGAEPTLRALRDAASTNRVRLSAFDLSPTVLEAIAAGDMAFAIDQQQYLQGYLPVLLLTLYVRYGLLPADDIRTGPGFVTRQNAERVTSLSVQGIR